MKLVFAAVYVLVLATQLPHIWHAYAGLEAADVPLANLTAWGAAIAFELSTGVFTLRVVQGSRRRWTRVGLAFFIVSSAVANATYYAWWPFVFDRLMPVFATLALPGALALFAEEFGAEVKREERRAKREQTPDPTPDPVPAPVGWPCLVCGQRFKTQQGLAGHMKAHTARVAVEEAPHA